MTKKNRHLITPLSRGRYAVAGLLLFAIKYNLDRAISRWGFDRSWFITDYWAWLDGFPGEEQDLVHGRLAWTLALTAIPFIALGTLLTLRRLRDAGLPGWTVAFFFLPILNLLFFGMLCLIPSKHIEGQGLDTHRRRWLDRVIPRTELGSALLALVVTTILGTGAAWFSISVLGEYGWSLFLGIPFMQGLAAALLCGYHTPRSFGKSVSVALLSLALLAGMLLLLAIEGLICLLMATPIAIPMILLGTTLGHQIQKQNRKGLPAALLIFLTLPLVSGIEHQHNRVPELVPVTTEVRINRPKQEVWNQLVTFSNIDPPKEWMFQAGIAYPVKAVIEGTGVGSVRRCRFTTGDFVEPITVWDEPDRLRFSVEKMPPPMVEWSFYDDLHLPHLEGYFVSEQGEFRLTSLPSGETLLEGTTWYRHDIWPRTYWRLWSDFILHTIHRRVLEHIKRKAEQPAQPEQP